MAAFEFSWFLHGLKLGGLYNVLLLYSSLSLHGRVAPSLLLPAQAFFVVNGYRCFLPNRYNGNTVLHRTVLSSSLVTRCLATVSEISWIYQLSVLLTELGSAGLDSPAPWLAPLAHAMVGAICVCQVCVWLAVLFDWPMCFFWEELGWAVIFVANTLASAFFYTAPGARAALGPRFGCVEVSLAFGAVYLPWQLACHLPQIYAHAASKAARAEGKGHSKSTAGAADMLWASLRSALFDMQVSTDSEDWGGAVGTLWMVGYWVVMPKWLFYIATQCATTS